MVLFMLLLAGLLLQSGCSSTPPPVFTFDQAAMPEAKPWTSKDFKNDPNNFQFVIIGDRTGGANVLGTFKLAMGQLNLIQPEFVINVGDIIEGYAEKLKTNPYTACLKVISETEKVLNLILRSDDEQKRIAA